MGFFSCTWSDGGHRFQIEDIGCAQIFHNGLDTWNHRAERAAEQSGKAHQREGTAPDACHKMQIAGHPVLACRGKQQDIVGAR